MSGVGCGCVLFYRGLRETAGSSPRLPVCLFPPSLSHPLSFVHSLLVCFSSEDMPEINRLEMRREVLLAGVRNGFAVAYDLMVPDPAMVRSVCVWL